MNKKIRNPLQIKAIAHSLFLIILLPSSQGHTAEFLDEPVETLETIEVPATAVPHTERHLDLPRPDTADLSPIPEQSFVKAGIPETLNSTPRVSRIVRDSIADRKGLRKPVRPAKAERPPYPLFAREQGWEGTVVLRIKVTSTGLVERIKTRKSSGFSILDESAIQSVKKWQFEPAKDGEFPIPVVVDLPIRFDLDKGN